jgi:hypothetical protein
MHLLDVLLARRHGRMPVEQLVLVSLRLEQESVSVKSVKVR